MTDPLPSSTVINADGPDENGLVVLIVKLHESALDDIRRIVREELERARLADHPAEVPRE